MWLLKYKLRSAYKCLQHVAETCLHYFGVQIKEKADYPKTQELANSHASFFRTSEAKCFSLRLLIILLRIVWFVFLVG